MALGASTLVSPVNAAVTGPRVIVVRPNDSAVAVTGLEDDEVYTITLRRGGLPVSTATGSSVGGALEVNGGAPTLCWNAVTPEIIPGDTVHLTGNGVNDFATVQDIKVTSRPVGNAGNTAFTVTGTLGAALDLDNVNVFVRLSVGGVDWRANANTVEEEPGNTLVRAGTTWTATFANGNDGDDPVDADVIAAARSPQVLEATYGVGGDVDGDPPFNEATAADFGAGDPIPDGCPSRATRAISNISPPRINLSNPGSGLTVSGVTGGVSPTVQVNLSDGTPPTVSKQAGLVGNNWTATFAASELESLDGRITVTASHAPIPGAAAPNTRTLLKDFVAPAAPSVSPDGGSFPTRLSVSLNGEPGATIFYTLGNGDPSQIGIPYSGPFLIRETTIVNAVQRDAAFNLSPPVTRTFTRLTPTAPGSGTPPGAGTRPGAGAPGGAGAVIPLAPAIAKAKSGKPRGAKTATARWRPPAANGAVRNGYDVRALKLRPNRGAKILRPKAVGPNATKLRMTLPKGKYRFQVRASSAAGDSPWSKRSNKVRAR